MPLSTVRSVGCALAVAIGLVVAFARPGAPFELKSIHFPVLSRGYLSDPRYAAQLDASLDELASTGANDVIVEVSVFMKDRFSSNVLELPDVSETLSRIEALIQAIKLRGLRVSFKPSLKFTTPGDWTGVASPADLTQWFATYKQMLLGYATFCEALGISTIYVGNELNDSVMAPEHRAAWLDILDAVRQVFHGTLSVNASTYDAAGRAYSITSIPFADQLDFVGVSFYIPRYTTIVSPTVDQLVSAWSANADGVNLIQYLKSISETYGKSVAISEIAYRSVRGYNTRAADGTYRDVVDYQEEVNLYEAFFRVWNQPGRPWFKGVSFWGWFAEYRPSSATRPEAWYAEQGSSVQGKPAMDSLRLGFTSLTLSPPSGTYVTTQQFDLTLVLRTAPGLSIAGGRATLDGADVTGGLVGCVKPGTLVLGGQTFRCPGLGGSLFGTGTHTLTVTLNLSNGSSVSDSVTWKVLRNTEP